MRKIILLLFSFVVLANSSNAQASLYGFTSSNTTYTPLTGATVHSSGSSMDDETFSVTLPFSFNFSGTAYTQIYISENGFISFGSNDPGTTTRSAISSSNTGFELAAALSRDLGGASATSELSSMVLGAGNTQKFVIQWKNIANYGSTESFNFQIILNQASDVADNQTIQFVYGSFTNLTSTSAQVGLRGVDNTIFNNRFTTTSWSTTTIGTSNSASCALSSTVFPASGLTFTYTPPFICSGTPIGGITNASTTSTCTGIPVSLSVTGSTAGAIGLTYQWQDSTGGGTFNDIVSETDESLSITPTVTTAYRRRIFCNGSTNQFSTPIKINLASPIFASLPFLESFETTWLNTCGGLRVAPSASWISSPLTGNNSWRRNDDNANGWSGTSGSYSPSSTAGAYSARFHSYDASSGSFGRMDLHIDCSVGSSDKRLSFDYINTSGSDSLEIFLSTDNGVSYTRLDSLRQRSSWFKKVIEFSSSSNQTILRFKATSDYGTTDIGLDNINVITIQPTDLAATSFVTPVGSLQVTNNGTITLRVTNVGSAPIDFATNNAVVGVVVTNPSGVSTTYSKTVNSGGLSSSGISDIVISSTVSFNTLGNYVLKAGFTLSGDGNNLNDSTNTVFVRANPLTVNAIANGNWGDVATWNGGLIPTNTDSVNIVGFNVTLDGAAAAPYRAYSLNIGALGILTGGPKALEIGTSGGGKAAFTVASTGTLIVNATTNITHNGFLLFNSGSNFTMSGGNLTIDGNDGTNAGSVTSSNDILGIGTSSTNFSSGTFDVTGGTITIVDPHRFSGSYALAYRATSGTHRNFGVGNTVVFGNGTSTHISNGVNGFLHDPYLNSGRLSYGNLTINTGSLPKRFTSHPYSYGVSGDFTINAGSDYRAGSEINVGGAFVNNGVFASASTIGLRSFLNATATPSTISQTVSGTGKFRNNIPTLTITTAGTGYAIGNTITMLNGTFSTPLSMMVTAVNVTGGITGASITNFGDYTVSPTYPAVVSGGDGTGATFTFTDLLSTAAFSSIVINNTNSSGVVLANTFNNYASQTGTISGTLTITNGILDNQGTVVLGTSTASRGTLSYTAGFIKGKFGRWYAASNNSTTTGDFPVGKDTVQNARVEFTTAPTKGGVLTAEFIKSLPGTVGLPLVDVSVTLERVANEGFWRITNDTITGGLYSLSLTGRKFANVQTLATLRSIKRPTNGSTWSLDGTAGTNSGTLAIPVVVRTGMSGFSDFAIAGGNDNVLPYTKLSFGGVKTASGNKLNWSVTNEFNTKGYQVERSMDGVNFAEINFVTSKNVLSIPNDANYSFTDGTPFKGNTYYRLKQIDNDGKTSYSQVVLMHGLKATTLNISGVYPNPAANLLNLVLASPTDKQVTLRVLDVNGKALLQQSKNVVSGDNVMQLNIQSLANGTYTVMVFCKDGCETKSHVFVKQ